MGDKDHQSGSLMLLQLQEPLDYGGNNDREKIVDEVHGDREYTSDGWKLRRAMGDRDTSTGHSWLLRTLPSLMVGRGTRLLWLAGKKLQEIMGDGKTITGIRRLTGTHLQETDG